MAHHKERAPHVRGETSHPTEKGKKRLLTSSRYIFLSENLICILRLIYEITSNAFIFTLLHRWIYSVCKLSSFLSTIGGKSNNEQAQDKRKSTISQAESLSYCLVGVINRIDN